MPVSDKSVRVYEELAEYHGRQNEPRQRDLFFVLAADAAFAAGKRDQAERLRQRLLAVNPHHLLKPFTSFGQALHSPDIQEFVADLRRQCPPETAEQMLEARRNGLPLASMTSPAAPAMTAPAAKTAEPELKVYRMQDAGEAQPPAAPPQNHAAAAAPRTAPPIRTRGAAPARPRAGDSPYAKGLTESPRVAGTKPEDSTAGAWVAVVLFVLVLAGTVALAAYTLLAPLFMR